MMRRLFFTSAGRLRRSAFWLASCGLLAAFGVGYALLGLSLGRGSTLVLYPPFFWAAFSLGAKRLHDRNRSAVWLVVVMVPLLGPAWLTFQMALRRGTPGDNAFGPDPRATRPSDPVPA
jgi:uncharacterized membrane protein YhaH (DUF805 family)